MNTANFIAGLKNETNTGGPFGTDDKLSLMGMVMAMIVGVVLMTHAARAAERPVRGLMQAAARTLVR